MLFEVEHITTYRYSVPVRLGEHWLRFCPIASPTQEVLDCHFDLTPAPVDMQQTQDNWGNTICCCRFIGETDSLTINARIGARTCQRQGYMADFELPPRYTQDLTPYLTPTEDDALLHDFVEPLRLAAGSSTLRFLDLLNQAVHGFYHRGVRLDGPPHSPAETLRLGEGVCRDLTVLFSAACRQLGLATRFVSGYQQGDGTRAIRYLHAWPEVYLPDVGWIGYDPTHGEPSGETHLAIAAAPQASQVTPVEGGYTFQGPQLHSTLDTDIRITTRP